MLVVSIVKGVGGVHGGGITLATNVTVICWLSLLFSSVRCHCCLWVSNVFVIYSLSLSSVLITVNCHLLSSTYWLSLSSVGCDYQLLVVNLSLCSGYDFAYLVRLLTNQDLPDTEQDFFDLTSLYFPRIFDVKYLMKSCKNLKGGLQDVADALEVCAYV